MTYKWETSDAPAGRAGAASVWLEDERGGGFTLLSSSGLGHIDWRQTQAPGRLRDVAQLLGAALPVCCRHAAIYPEGFAFCPQCGATLERPAAPPRPAWWGAATAPGLPGQLGHGWPAATLELAAALERRGAGARPKPDLSLPAPPNGECVFAAADFGFAAQRLLALAPRRGVLQYWDPAGARWHLLAAEEGSASLAFSASAYAWLPAASSRRGEVALAPAEHGLLRLGIDPVSQTYRAEPLLRAALAGAPGALRQRVACLYAEDGRLMLWNAGPDGGASERAACVPGPGADAAPLAGWSRPFAYDEQLAWLHPGGQLLWRPGGAPRWLAWPADWVPRLGFGGPVQSLDGRLWLLGHRRGRYAFLELGVAGGQVQETNGARLGFGRFLFRGGHPVPREPWDAERVEDQSEDDTLVLPLLQQFDARRATMSGLVLRVAPCAETAEAALREQVAAHPLRLEWIGRRNVLLDKFGAAGALPGYQAFVYDNCLWLHHPQAQAIRGWRLDAAP